MGFDEFDSSGGVDVDFLDVGRVLYYLSPGACLSCVVEGLKRGLGDMPWAGEGGREGGKYQVVVSVDYGFVAWWTGTIGGDLRQTVR